MRTNEGAGRSSLQTKVIVILTVPAIFEITFCNSNSSPKGETTGTVEFHSLNLVGFWK